MKIKWVQFFFSSVVILMPLLYLVGLFFSIHGIVGTLLGGLFLIAWILIAIGLQHYFFVIEPRERGR